MGLYEGIHNAKYSEGGNYIKVGIYHLEIIEFKYKFTFKKQHTVLAKFKVLESSGEGADPVGSETTWMVNLAHAPALGNLAQFVQSVVNDYTTPVTEEIMEKLTNSDASKGPVNPMKGYKVRASVTQIITQGKKQPFNRAKFFPDNSGDAAAKSNQEDTAQAQQAA